MKTTMVKKYTYAIGMTLIFIAVTQFNQVYAQDKVDKPTLLIHLTQGPENPTVAALAFLVAKTAVEDGHQVTLFLAGDAVQIMREGVLENLNGLGTGSVKAHYEVLAGAGCQFYLSGMSSKSRGLSMSDLKGKKVEMASPELLLRLTMENDKMFVY
jgi:predicted peroxiredoxin